MTTIVNTEINEQLLRIAPDLNTRAPRSLRIKLGGYAALPRMIDKCRASLLNKAGEYHYNCPLDKLFLNFTGIDADAIREVIAEGRGDGEILEWVQANSSKQPSPWEIDQWSNWVQNRQPEPNTESFDFYQETLKGLSVDRGDIRTWAELLDLDDYCSFGGAA